MIQARRGLRRFLAHLPHSIQSQGWAQTRLVSVLSTHIWKTSKDVDCQTILSYLWLIILKVTFFFFSYTSLHGKRQNITQHCFIFSFISLISKSLSLWSPSFLDFYAWHYKGHHWYHWLHSTSDPKWCPHQYLFLRAISPSGKVHVFKYGA